MVISTWLLMLALDPRRDDGVFLPLPLLGESTGEFLPEVPGASVGAVVGGGVAPLCCFSSNFSALSRNSLKLSTITLCDSSAWRRSVPRVTRYLSRFSRMFGRAVTNSVLLMDSMRDAMMRWASTVDSFFLAGSRAL